MIGLALFCLANNILAALHNNNGTYEWVQVNPPTGIDSADITPGDAGNNLIKDSLTIITAAENYISD